MAILVEPSKMVARLTPKKTVEKLVTRKLTVNRAVLSTLSQQDFLSQIAMEKIAIKVISGYKEQYKEELDQGESKEKAFENAVNDRKQMVHRVQTAVVHEISESVRESYQGEFYIWLPSSSINPDPLHQLNYGKKFRVGVGEMPGERFGCMCGMRILVKEEKLKIA